MDARLTDRERELIRDTFANRPVVVTDDEDGVRVSIDENYSSTPEGKVKKRRFYRRYTFWAAIVFIPSIVISAVILGIVFRVQSAVGQQALERFAEEGVSPEVNQVAIDAGFDWLPLAADVYSNMWTIIIGSMAVSMLLAIGLIALEQKYRSGEAKKLNEEIAEELRKLNETDGDEEFYREDDEEDEDDAHVHREA